MICSICDFYLKQKMLYNKKCLKTDIMWVGLSAKLFNQVGCVPPLDLSTNTGKIIKKIEDINPNLLYYKSNLVKYAPINSDGKLRYPTKEEMDFCFPCLYQEINTINPKLVFLLGDKVSNFVLKKFGFMIKKDFMYRIFVYENMKFVPIYHPSYIWIYKRKEESKYIHTVYSVIAECFDNG